MLRIVSVLCFVFSIGCAKHHYIVYREVPECPHFVVLPVSQSAPEISFAADIEQSIMANGVKVVQRPAIKKHEVVRSRDEDSFFSQKGEEDLTESYSAYNIPPDYADYFVLTTYVDKRVKIYNPKTKEILTIFHIEYESNIGTPQKQQTSVLVGKHLDAMGILIAHQMQSEISKTRLKRPNWKQSFGIVLLGMGVFVVLSLINTF